MVPRCFCLGWGLVSLTPRMRRYGGAAPWDLSINCGDSNPQRDMVISGLGKLDMAFWNH